MSVESPVGTPTEPTAVTGASQTAPQPHPTTRKSRRAQKRADREAAVHVLLAHATALAAPFVALLFEAIPARGCQSPAHNPQEPIR